MYLWWACTCLKLSPRTCSNAVASTFECLPLPQMVLVQAAGSHCRKTLRFTSELPHAQGNQKIKDKKAWLQGGQLCQHVSTVCVCTKILSCLYVVAHPSSQTLQQESLLPHCVFVLRASFGNPRRKHHSVSLCLFCPLSLHFLPVCSRQSHVSRGPPSIFLLSSP